MKRSIERRRKSSRSCPLNKSVLINELDVFSFLPFPSISVNLKSWSHIQREGYIYNQTKTQKRSCKDDEGDHQDNERLDDGLPRVANLFRRHEPLEHHRVDRRVIVVSSTGIVRMILLLLLFAERQRRRGGRQFDFHGYRGEERDQREHEYEHDAHVRRAHAHVERALHLLDDRFEILGERVDLDARVMPTHRLEEFQGLIEPVRVVLNDDDDEK